MDLIAMLAARFRTAARYKAALSVVERIQAIPGYQRVNFLMSLLQQAQRGRALSDKQLAVLEKIEREQGGAKPAAPEKAPSNAIEWAKGGYYNTQDSEKLLSQLRKDGEANVYDARGHFMSKFESHLSKHFRKELAMDFAGLWEQYLEYNADEDDPREARLNSQIAREADEASHFITEKLKIDVKQNGRNLVVTISPTMQQIQHKMVPSLRIKRDWR